MRTTMTTAAALTCLLATASYAEDAPMSFHHRHHPVQPAPVNTATATGTGVGIAKSSSQSGAVAISGQGGSANSQLTVNNPANTNSTATVNSNISGSTTSNINQRVSGTTTVKNVPSTVAPSLAAAGLETCLGSASGTVSAVGFGVGGGSTYVDEGCQARLDSRTLYAYGLKAAAVARLCARPDIWRSMPDMCTQYWPVGVPYPNGIAYAEPTGAGLPVKALMSAETGVIRVVDGRDGVEKDCLNYSHTKQKCHQWAGEPKRQRSAALTPVKQQSKPNWTRPAEKQKAEPVPASVAPAPDNK